MLQHTDRFTTSAPYRQALIQEGCPVYIHCSRICTERRTADRFLQLRLVNRWDREIESLVLCVDGFDAWGNLCGKISGLILPDCRAKGHSIFGEDRLISLGKLRAARIEVAVECVRFSDGMTWNARAIHNPRPLEETDWTLCSCGLPNGPEQTHCDLCGRSLKAPACELPLPVVPAALPEEREAQEEIVPAPPVFRPEPILRSPEELRESCNAFVFAAQEYEEELEEEEDDGVPRWLFVLLCIIGGIALSAALVFLFHFLKNANLL